MKRRSKGISIIYVVITFAVLCGFCSFAVDLGRVQLAKTELRRAADGAARAGAAGIPTDLGTATDLAVQFAKANKVDGTPLALDSSKDIEYGKWDATTKKFTKTSTGVNAIHVTARRTQARGNAIPMMFASLVGFKMCDVTADVVVMVIPPVNVNQFVPATANPFLSGMPVGTTASAINPSSRKIADVAGTTGTPQNSPLAVALPVSDNQIFTFDSIDGTARHDPSLAYVNPDGDLSERIGHNNLTTNFDNNYGSKMYNEHGIADAWIPINSLVGIFLSDDAPDKDAAPSNLDFRSDDSRDFSSLKPGLKQIFFIGDGLDSKGNHQSFVAPKGATRLYLATWDYYEWNNNAGSRNIKVNRPMQIITVK